MLEVRTKERSSIFSIYYILIIVRRIVFVVVDRDLFVQF